MDDERYERYLGDTSFGQPPRQEHGATEKSLACVLQSAFTDAKNKIGLGGYSNATILCLLLIIAALCGFALWSYSPGLDAIFGASQHDEAPSLSALDDSTDDPSGSRESDLESSSNDAASKNSIYVHVSGAVRNPDVYELEPSSRVIDAISAAGGFSDLAASEALNLAATLDDGMQVHVLTGDEFELQGGSTAIAAASSGAGGSFSAPGTGVDGMLNLNSADSSALQSLPGIGPVTADKIVKDREERGPFSSVEDLMRVSGIGQKRVEGLEGLVSVGP